MCEGLAAALRTTGCPEQILTDNGKVFTGRYNRPPVEVLFDRICRENGIEHLLTQPRSPTTTGKIERFHRALRTEFRTDRVFASWRRAGRAGCLGRRLQHPPAASGDGHGRPGRAVPAGRAGAVTPLRLTQPWRPGAEPW